MALSVRLADHLRMTTQSHIYAAENPSVRTSSPDPSPKSAGSDGVGCQTRHVDGAVSSEDAGAGLEIGGGAQ